MPYLTALHLANREIIKHLLCTSVPCEPTSRISHQKWLMYFSQQREAWALFTETPLGGDQTLAHTKQGFFLFPETTLQMGTV